jgi:serine/threonine-protein kinase TTK/MPS1
MLGDDKENANPLEASGGKRRTGLRLGALQPSTRFTNAKEMKIPPFSNRKRRLQGFTGLRRLGGAARAVRAGEEEEEEDDDDDDVEIDAKSVSTPQEAKRQTRDASFTPVGAGAPVTPALSQDAAELQQVARPRAGSLMSRLAARQGDGPSPPGVAASAEDVTSTPKPSATAQALHTPFARPASTPHSRKSRGTETPTAVKDKHRSPSLQSLMSSITRGTDKAKNFQTPSVSVSSAPPGFPSRAGALGSLGASSRPASTSPDSIGSNYSNTSLTSLSAASTPASTPASISSTSSGTHHRNLHTPLSFTTTATPSSTSTAGSTPSSVNISPPSTTTLHADEEPAPTIPPPLLESSAPIAVVPKRQLSLVEALSQQSTPEQPQPPQHAPQPTIKPEPKPSLQASQAKQQQQVEKPPQAKEEQQAAQPSQAKPQQQTVQRAPQAVKSKPADKTVFMVNGKPYFQLEVIGSGGSSEVSRVLSKDKKVYALKKIKVEQGNAGHVANYRNEIALLKRLRGRRQVIELIDSEEDTKNSNIYMVFELGQCDLAQYLKLYRDTLDENATRYYWRQILECTQICHEEHVIHLDLKPANFVFVDGTIKIIDFGIAKEFGADTTNIMRESQVGTLNYMSPESINDSTGSEHHKLGRSSDIWSLGCILYQMVFGATPFSHLKMIQKMRCITDPNFKIDFEKEGKCTDPALREVLRACLSRDPKRRPTIPQLLKHPYMRPTERLQGVEVPLSVNQLATLLTELGVIDAEKIAKGVAQQASSGKKIDLAGLRSDR